MPPSVFSDTAPFGGVDGEWTFEDALERWFPMVRPVQHVGVPGHQFQAGVLWDGSLVFGPLGFRELEVMQRETAPLGDNLLHVSVGFGEPMRFVDRRGSGSRSIRRGLEDGCLPIPWVETQDGYLVWNETVAAAFLGREFAAGLDPRPDDMLVVHVGFRVANTGAEGGTGHLWLHFGDTTRIRLGYKCEVDLDLAPAIAQRFEAHCGMVGGKVRYIVPEPVAGELQWHDHLPPPDGSATPAERVLEWRVPLAAGAEAELDLVIPYGLCDPEQPPELLAAVSPERLAEVRAAWGELVSGPTSITTPDPFLNDYLRAVAGQMSQQVGYRWSTDVWMYKTSPNHYEGYWPCNAAKALPAFDMRGLSCYSRPVLGSFIDQQTANTGRLTRSGMGFGEELEGEGYEQVHGFLGNFGEWTANTLVLSHGLELWALASHYRITRDDEWLGEGPGSPLRAIVDACDWLALQRRRTMREVDGTKVAHWGLLPAASAHDWLSGNTIFNDAFCIYGMAEAVRMLREIGHPRAEALAEELRSYRADLRERYVEARNRARPIPMPDGSELPFVPRDVYELDWAKIDWTYAGYGPLRAGAWGALDPHDELVDQCLAFSEAGLPAGEGFYFTGHITHGDTADRNWASVANPSADRHYLWKHYVEYETMWPLGNHLFLARDDLPRYFEWLFNNLAVVVHRDWRVGVESIDGVPSNAPGDGERWLAVRGMFLREDGGYDGGQQSLLVLQAIPRCWLKPGATMGVRGMGTHFGGNADVSVRVADDGDSVSVSVRLDLAVEPARVLIRLRSGDGRPLASATVNGAEAPVMDGDRVELPRSAKARYEVVGRF